MTVAGKGGRPKWLVTTDVLKIVEDASFQGMTKEQISYLVGLNPTTYISKQKEFPELVEAFARGKAKGIKFVTNKLLELCKDKNPQSVQFYLKSKAGWKENDPSVLHYQPIVFTVDGKEVKLGIDEE